MRSITDHDGQSVYDGLVQLLEQLAHGCEEQQRPSERSEGWLWWHADSRLFASEEVRLLRVGLASRAWTASYEEPLDGGVVRRGQAPRHPAQGSGTPKALGWRCAHIADAQKVERGQPLVHRSVQRSGFVNDRLRQESVVLRCRVTGLCKAAW